MTHVLKLELSAEDRTESPLFSGIGEPHSAVQAIRVGERERVEALLDRGVGKVIDIRGAVQKAVIAVNVQVDPARHLGLPTAPWPRSVVERMF